MTQIEVLEFLISKSEGRTQLELAKAIHGEAGYQQQVNQDLSMLVSSGRVQCRGLDRYRYYPVAP